MSDEAPSATQPSPNGPFKILTVLCWIAAATSFKFPAVWLYLLVFALAAAALFAARRVSDLVPKLIVLMALVSPVWQLGNELYSTWDARHDVAVIGELVTTEERILELTPKLGQLSRSLMNLRFPDEPRRNLFAGDVTVVGLQQNQSAALENAALKSGANEYEIGPEGIFSTTDLSLWRPLLDQVSWFEHAKFYIVDGHFPDSDQSTFEAEVGFSGLAKMKDGQWRGLHGKQTVTWKKIDATVEPEWKISRWETHQLSAAASTQRLFSESLGQALPQAADLQKARRSEHQQAAIKFYRDGAKKYPHPYFAPISANQKPGLAVADIDSDGDDDIYVTVRMGKNLLLENQGDGTFIESAAEHGLDVHGHSTCALLADFDNDGDPDLVLGRSLAPSQYYENQAGHFTRVRQATELPRLAISLSATDYNGDGLLDFYLLTYRPATIGQGSSPAGGVAKDASKWPDEFFPPRLAAEYYHRHSESGSNADPLFPALLNQMGPPNILYVNQGGGRFKPAKENKQLGIWRNSLQATWADYDQDGDPDVYIANDWAPDNLFRNDGKAGFTDVTAEARTTAYGFAMGATWGDYDNDGRQDLYVSNMYSKAGHRITGRVKDLAETFRESAAGNYLYRQREDRSFDLVSGEKPPGLAVAKAGWSWGGQFADFNNDGFLDLYALSGYFTAPQEVASDVDL